MVRNGKPDLRLQAKPIKKQSKRIAVDWLPNAAISQPIIQDLPPEFYELLGGEDLRILRRRLGDHKIRSLLHYLHHELGIPATAIANSFGKTENALRKWFKAFQLEKSSDRRPVIKSRLILIEPPKSLQSYFIRLDEELAYLMGFMIGDGHVNRETGRLLVLNVEHSLKEPIRRVLSRFTHLTETEGFSGSKWWRLDGADVAFSRLFNKEVVEYTLNDSKFAKNFIAGFYDADGGKAFLTRKSISLRFYNKDPTILKSVRDSMIQNYDIKSGPVRIEIGKRARAKLGDRMYGKTDIYTFVVSNPGFHKFLRQIYPHVNHKQRRESITQVASALGLLAH